MTALIAFVISALLFDIGNLLVPPPKNESRSHTEPTPWFPFTVVILLALLAIALY